MKKIKIAIIFGGCSSEYEVSLKSAHSVISSMDNERYEIILLGITKNGEWIRYYGETNKILDDTWFLDKRNCIPACISPSREIHGIVELTGGSAKITKIDIAFPILHGKNGEDGTVQGLMELAGIPIVGCDSLSSAICMDKDKAHKLVALAGVKIPEAFVFTLNDDFEKIVDLMKGLQYPVFVKPVKAGSSMGITKVYKKDELMEAINIAFEHDNQVIVEENILGFEVGCAVLGNEKLTIGELDEIELMEGFFDYTEKYTLNSSKIHMPARINEELAYQIKQTAQLIYKSLGCCGFARIDMFITPKEEIIFNEVNTIPGFTTHSRYPNMMKGIGISFVNIVDKLIHLGLRK